MGEPIVIPVEGGKTYTISKKLKAVEMLDVNMNPIYIVIMNKKKKTFEVPLGIHAVRFL